MIYKMILIVSGSYKPPSSAQDHDRREQKGSDG